MKARLLLIPAVLLLFSLTGCKKDDVKPLTFEAVLGSYEGDMITKTSLLGEQTTTVKKTLTIEKSNAEGKDGKITGNIAQTPRTFPPLFLSHFFWKID